MKQARSFADYPGGHAEGYPDTHKQLFRRFYASIGDPSLTPDYPQMADGLRQMKILEAELASHKAHAWMDVASLIYQSQLQQRNGMVRHVGADRCTAPPSRTSIQRGDSSSCKPVLGFQLGDLRRRWDSAANPSPSTPYRRWNGYHRCGNGSAAPVTRPWAGRAPPRSPARTAPAFSAS